MFALLSSFPNAAFKMCIRDRYCRNRACPFIMWSWGYKHGRQVCGREELSSERFLSLPPCFLLSCSRQVRHFVAAVATSTDGVFELALEVVAETPGELGDGFVEAGGRVIALRCV